MSEDEAKKKAKRVNKKIKPGFTKTNAFECDRCGWWHIGKDIKL